MLLMLLMLKDADVDDSNEVEEAVAVVVVEVEGRMCWMVLIHLTPHDSLTMRNGRFFVRMDTSLGFYSCKIPLMVAAVAEEDLAVADVAGDETQGTLVHLDRAKKVRLTKGSLLLRMNNRVVDEVAKMVLVLDAAVVLKVAGVVVVDHLPCFILWLFTSLYFVLRLFLHT